MTAIAALTFAVLSVAGMPLAFALGVGAALGLAYGEFPSDVLAQRMLYAVDSFPLVAVPLFMLAGELMVKGGIMERLIDFANSIVGRVRGGLAHVCLVSGTCLSAVSGAAVADASALGSTLVPSLRKAYDNGFASAVVAAAANLGPIIPPSAAMIVYAIMAGSLVSVGGLFMAGVVPGLMMAAGMMALCSYLAHRRGYPTTGVAFSIRNVLREARRSAIIFMMPVVVLGGIVGGAFTATEGAAVAVAYALFIGFFVTRRLRLRDLPHAMFQAALVSSILGILIACASAMTFLFTVDLIPLWLTQFLQALTRDPHVFLSLVMLGLLVVGMFIEANAAYIMLVPLLAPIAMTYGIDPLHFGFLFVLNMVIGGLTPPVGILLFVLSGITGISMAELVRNVWPFILVQAGVLVLCAIFPGIVLWLPRLMGY
jgi:tripartite ATP-independent transporter DctM subunit